MSDFKITAMTPEVLKEKFPDVFAVIENQGHVKGLSEGYEKGCKEGHVQGFNAGAESERKRIEAVEAQSLVGHEALIAQLKADGKTTGEQAAMMVLSAEKEKRKTRMQSLEDSSIKPVQPSNTDSDQFTKTDTTLPVEERCKKEWEQDTKLQTEFTSFASYVAYKKATEAGRVKILSRAKSV